MYGTLCYHILPNDFRTFTIAHPFVWVHVEYCLFFFGLARQPGPMWQHARALRNRAQEPSNSSCWSCHSKWGWRENFQNELGSMTIFLQPHFEFSNRLANIGQGVHDDYVWTILDIFMEIFTASRPICVVFTTRWVRRPPCFFLEQWHGETRVLQVQMTGKSMGLEAFRAESYPNWLAGFVSRSSFFWMCLTSPVSQPSAIAGHGCAVPLCCSPKWLDPIVNHAFWVCFIYFSAGKWWLYTSENTIYTFS